MSTTECGETVSVGKQEVEIHLKASAATSSPEPGRDSDVASIVVHMLLSTTTSNGFAPWAT